MASSSPDYDLSMGGLSELPKVTLSNGETFAVTSFVVREALSELFHIELVLHSNNTDLEYEPVLGRDARFSVPLYMHGLAADRGWTGILTAIEQTESEVEDGQAEYRLVLSPSLWLATQKRNYRIFQEMSELEIALDMLARWGIEPQLDLNPGDYQKRRYRVQYAETDYAFICRMLEDIGVAFFFLPGAAGQGGLTQLVLSDSPNQRSERPKSVPYNRGVSKTNLDRVSELAVGQIVAPGRFTQSDVDYRRPAEFPVRASANDGGPVEQQLEQYHHDYGAFWWRVDQGEPTPLADDRGMARSDLNRGRAQVVRRLEAERNARRVLRGKTTAHDLWPGVVFRIEGHPRAEISGERAFLVSSVTLTGTYDSRESEFEARWADVDYRPPMRTPKPRVMGVESATVVGPPGEEIHTDEFARVRVHFHWDREGQRTERDSCWIPVSQPWGGTSFGALSIPRIGQEVLVDFLGGDPDRPVITGRVFTRNNPVPYTLPQHKTVTGLRSESSPRLMPGVPRSGMLGGKAAGGGEPVSSPTPQTSALGMGLPMALNAISEAIGASRFFGAASPSAETHQWSGSELTFDDTQGTEVAYFQAQKDYHGVVKNASKSVVGNSQATQVGTDDVLSVGNKQAFTIGSDRSVAVGGTQAHVVQSDVLQQSVTGNQAFVTELAYTSDALAHRMTSGELTVLEVGTSTIVMAPDFIVIQADDVFINPGEEATEAAKNGTKPETPQERSQREAAEAAAAEAAEAHAAAMEYAPQDARQMLEHRDMMPPGGRLDDAAQRDLMVNDLTNSYGDALSQTEIEGIVDSQMAQIAEERADWYIYQNPGWGQ